MLNSLMLVLMSLAFAKDIHVMMIDAGVDKTHPVLRGKVITSENQVPHEHGTQVASFILYDGLNIINRPASGLCPEVKLTSCDYIVEGLYTCLAKAVVFDYVNISLQGSDDSPLEKRLIQIGLNNGATYVVAAGNSGIKDLKRYRIYPASYLYELKTQGRFFAVGDETASGSNWGEGLTQMDYSGRGASNGGGSNRMSGTSVSSPKFLHQLLKARCAQ